MDLVILNNFFCYSLFSFLLPSLLSNRLNIAEFLPIKFISLMIVITFEKDTISGLCKQKGHR